MEQNNKNQKAPLEYLLFYVAGRLCAKFNRLSGAVIVGGATTVKGLRKKPAIRATLHSLRRKMKTGKAEIHREFDHVNKQAGLIVKFLKLKKVSPKRIAIDGIPGSGKTTLARALAKKMNFKRMTLDYIDMDKPLDFSEEKTIYEHHRLLRTQDIDPFDCIIYIDAPIDISKKRCLHRKRGAVNIDVFDYQKLKHIGERAFKLADGKVHHIDNSFIQIKIRPRKGYQAYENLCAEIKRKGLKTKRRSKESLLFVSLYGKGKKGLKAYIKFGAYNKEFKAGLRAGIKQFFMS